MKSLIIQSRLYPIFNNAKKLQGIKNRLWAKINVGNKNECWEWKAKTTHHFGYGHITYSFKNKARKIAAHRVAYALTYGIIDDDICVLHKCDNPKCCNPNHLFLGTRIENNRDCINKKRNFSDLPRQNKLTENEVVNIINDNRSPSSIAGDYNVGVGAIKYIKAGRTWKHIPRNE